MLGGGSGLGGGGGNSLRQLSGILAPEAEEDSALTRVLKTISRPGFALRAAAAGDFEAAGKNLAQLALDIPTGGFVAPHLSLANLFDSTGDITERKDRYEATDTLRKWGFNAPKSTLGKLGVDLVGGVLTDPLTYLTFGGSGLGKGALKGFAGGIPDAALAATRRSQAGEILFDALARTPGGKAALDGAVDVVRRQPGMARFDAELLESLGGVRRAETVGPLETFSKGSLEARLDRYTKLKAVEHVVGEAVGEPGFRFVGMADADAAAMLEDGLDVLYRRNLLRDQTSVRFSLFGHESNPIVRNFWAKVGSYGTLPGLARKGLHAFPEGSAPKLLAEHIDAAAAQAWEWLHVSMLDKKGGRAVPAALQHQARDLATQRKTADFDDANLVNQHLGWLEQGQRERLTEVLGEAHDLHHRLLRDPMLDPSEIDPTRWTPEQLWERVRAELPEDLARDLADNLPQAARAKVMQKALANWNREYDAWLRQDQQLADAIQGARDTFNRARDDLSRARNELEAMRRAGQDVAGAEREFGRRQQAFDDARQAFQGAQANHRRAYDDLQRMQREVDAATKAEAEARVAYEQLRQQAGAAADPAEGERLNKASIQAQDRWKAARERLRAAGDSSRAEAARKALDEAKRAMFDARQAFNRWDNLRARGPVSADPKHAEKLRQAEADLKAAADRVRAQRQAARPQQEAEDAARATMDQAEQAFAGAQADLTAAQERLRQARAGTAERQRAADDVEAARQRRDQARAAVYAARREHRAFRKRMAQAESRGDRAARRAQESTLEGWIANLALERARRELPDADPARLEEALGAYFRSMEQIPSRLKDLGVYHHADGHAFYFPFQASPKLAAAMSDAAVDQRFGRAIRSVFDRRRQYARYKARDADLIEAARERLGAVDATDDELLAFAAANDLGSEIGFVDALEKVAADHGFAADDLEDVVTNDLGELWLRRLRAFRMTEERAQLSAVARERFGMRPGDAVDAYVDRQFKALNTRKDWLSVLLGGGRFTFKAPDGTEYVWPKPGGKRKWRGLNYLYKPALTVLFPSFHGRNAASAAVMSFYDPDLGLPAVLAQLNTLRNAPALRALDGAGVPRAQAADFLAALAGDPEAIARASRLRIGSYSGDEVLQQLKGSVRSSGGGAADLFEDFRQLNAIGTREDAEGFFGRNFERAVGMGTRVSDWIENSFRVAGYLKLVGKGVEPTEAARRIGRAYVDYDRQSVVERFVRDVVPFARFQIGITPVVAKEFAQRPRVALPFARMVGSTEKEDKASGLLPEDVRSGVAIDLGGGQYITSLGLPFEPAAAVAEGLTSFAGARRLFGGGLQPLIRTPLEATADRSFFFGGEFGEYRRAPAYLPDSLTTKVQLPGGAERREVPSVVNDWLIGAAPWSRVLKFVDRWARDDYSTVQKVVQSAMGVRIRNVDELREIKNAIVKVLEREARTGRVGTVEQFFARVDDLPEPVRVALEGLPAVKKAMAQRAGAGGLLEIRR